MLMLTHINKDKTFSICSSDTGQLRHFKQEDIPANVLGIFRDNNGVITEMRCVQPSSYSDVLMPAISEIKTPELREYARNVCRLIPRYFYSVPASSSGKYHPASDLGDGGLVRHTLAVCKVLSKMMGLANMQVAFSQVTIDCMLIACLLHDSLKSGWDEDYELNNHTKHEHPLLAAKMVRSTYGLLGNFPNGNYCIELIASCISTHMGQWNTSKYSSYELPVPNTPQQMFVHMADYLAAQREINMVHDNNVYALKDQNVIYVD